MNSKLENYPIIEPWEFEKGDAYKVNSPKYLCRCMPAPSLSSGWFEDKVGIAYIAIERTITYGEKFLSTHDKAAAIFSSKTNLGSTLRRVTGQGVNFIYGDIGYPLWLFDVQREDKSGNHLAALNLLFKQIDKMLRLSLFEEVDKIIESLSLQHLSENLIVGFLSITRPAWDRLPSRQKFFDDAWKVVESRGRNPVRLLNGLRGQRRPNGDNS